MNNFIVYFYKIHIQELSYHDNYYSFIYNGYMYKLYFIDDNIDVNFLVNINKKLIGHTLSSEIIMNKDGNYVSTFNNKHFMLIKIFANPQKKISLMDISYLADTLHMQNKSVNWGNLWSKKIDYLEELINENGKKYPLMVDSFNYFVGLAENAIAYFNDIVIDKNYDLVISHKAIRFNDSVEVLYNPLNMIFDYKVRDVAEYIKNSFFLDNKDIYNEIDNYLKTNRLTIIDIKLLIARLLYPSFYFAMYEDILIYDKNEKILIPIVNRLVDYEKYLAKIIDYFKKMYDISEIDWLKK